MRRLRKLHAQPLCSSGDDIIPPSRPTPGTPLRTTSVENLPSDCDPRKRACTWDAQTAPDRRKGFAIPVGSMKLQP